MDQRISDLPASYFLLLLFFLYVFPASPTVLSHRSLVTSRKITSFDLLSSD
jgi:hypothetical protein